MLKDIVEYVLTYICAIIMNIIGILMCFTRD